MELLRGNKGRIIRPVTPEMVASALERFRRSCRFEPETGCVLWTGGVGMGRGHSDPYPKFWFNGQVWFGHRWAAKFIHGQDIDGFQTDHCCPNRPIPHTLCVQHTQSLTPRQNRELQTERRRHFIHLQVGLRDYFECYGHEPGAPQTDPTAMPFYDPPAWLALTKEPIHDECPF